MRDSLLAFVAVIFGINVFFAALLAAVFGGDPGMAVYVVAVEVLKPALVILTVHRVVRHPPEGAGQLRTLLGALRARERPEDVGPALLALEVVAATIGVVGFAGVVLFADFSTITMPGPLSLALALGLEPIYLAGSTASLATYSAGVVLWTATWVLEGLEVTGTNPLPR